MRTSGKMTGNTTYEVVRSGRERRRTAVSLPKKNLKKSEKICSKRLTNHPVLYYHMTCFFESSLAERDS